MSLPPSYAKAATNRSDRCWAGVAPATGKRLSTAHGELVLVKPSPAGKTPYCWGKLLEPLYSKNESPLESRMWTVERLTDQEFSDHIKTELLQRDKILTIDEALNMYRVSL